MLRSPIDTKSETLPDIRAPARIGITWPSGPPDAEHWRRVSRRVAEAMRRGRPRGDGEARSEDVELDAAMTYASHEVLRKRDFEDMSADELSAAPGR